MAKLRYQLRKVKNTLIIYSAKEIHKIILVGMREGSVKTERIQRKSMGEKQ